MAAPILLTAFAPWQAHQRSNSSDDLVALVATHPRCPGGLVIQRQVPVHFDLAPAQVIAQALVLRPALVVCCGMAETRSRLTLERFGRRGDRRLQTRLDLAALTRDLALTTISDDAGDYVCNHLYYHLLRDLPRYVPHCQSLFVHVPRLHHRVQPWLLLDFLTVLTRLRAIADGEGLPLGGRLPQSQKTLPWAGLENSQDMTGKSALAAGMWVAQGRSQRLGRGQ